MSKRASNKREAGDQVFLALLRGINVGGHKKLPMAELRELALGLGCSRAETYIQSGNLVVRTAHSAGELEVALERAIAGQFGFSVAVVVRSRSEWLRYAAHSPFPQAESERPHLLHLGLAKQALRPGAVEALQRYASHGERFSALHDALWIDYCGGSGKSKVTPAVLDRCAGSSVTTRNWRTVQKLKELMQGSS